MEENENPKIRVLVLSHYISGLSLESAAEDSITLAEFRKFTADLPGDTKIVIDRDDTPPDCYASMTTSEIDERWIL